MKIAMVSHLARKTVPTGAERSLSLLAGGLQQRGHKVRVAAPGPWVLGPDLENSGVSVASIPIRNCWLTQFGSQPLWRQIGRGIRFVFPDSGPRILREWLRRHRPDAVHINCLPNLRGAQAGHACGLPVIWHIREILPPGPRRTFFAGRLRRDATHIVAVSEAVAAWLREERLGDLVDVVHNGVRPPDTLPEAESARRRLGLPPGGVVVGLFGQLIPHKGALDFVHAAHLAAREEPSLRFLIAGDGPPAFVNQVHQLAEDGAAAENIHLLPPQGDIWTLMAASDIVAQTTLWPDPLPRVVMEAMAAERPVVAYSNGGVPEMVVDGATGFLLGPGDRNELAAAIVRLARNPEQRRLMGETAADRARRLFSTENHLDRMERLFVQAAQKKRNAG
ncbi:MAG: glycosyltransferase family 4 protein [Thermoanaerobaculales bacterium]|nr:glycosyltransferase family 4 protein [Thermoanaerobaculales bacterium]